MLSVKTKKYQLPVNTYVKIGMKNIFKEQWWAFLVPIAVVLPSIFFPKALIWLIVSAIILLLIYIFFWFVQFYGITQLPQGKPLFEKLNYEVDNKQILIKRNSKEGMALLWDQIKDAEKTNDAFFLKLSKVQFIHLPFSIFNSENDIKFTEAILRRKKLLPEK